MDENNKKFLSVISNLHPKNNAINILKDIRNIPFFVYTIPKTGTTTLSLSLQKMVNNQRNYQHVVHCHNESCWKRTFNIDFDFDIMSLIKYQKKKPIIFQLSRNPIKRLISFFFHVVRNRKTNSTYTELLSFLEKQKNNNYLYYQKKFDYNLRDLHYNYNDKCCVMEKNDYILFFMKLEDFNNHLKSNLIKYLNKHGYDFNRFNQYIANVSDKRYHKNTLNEIKKKGIPKEICQSIFNNNLDEINFFFSTDEIKKMETDYDIKINKQI